MVNGGEVQTITSGLLKNMARNYEERRIGLVQGIAVRPE